MRCAVHFLRTRHFEPWLIALGILGPASACRIVDLDHCAHRIDDAGRSMDAWCMAAHALPYCDRCRPSGDRGGCSAERPVRPECMPTEPFEGGTGSSSSESSGAEPFDVTGRSVTIESSVVVRNAEVGVRATGTTLDLRFSSLLGNDAAGGLNGTLNLECVGSTMGSLVGSIVLHPRGPSIQCGNEALFPARSVTDGDLEGEYRELEELFSDLTQGTLREPTTNPITDLGVVADAYLGDPRFQRMFKAEVELSALLNHVNIVHVFDEGEDAGRRYLVMEWVDGVNLLKLKTALDLVDDEPLRLRVIAYVVGQLLYALKYAHSITLHDGNPSASCTATSHHTTCW